MTCGTNQAFSSAECSPNSCGEYTIEHTTEGSTVCSGTTGYTCTYTCETGFTDTAQGLATCGPSGSFDAVTCTADPCAPVSIEFSNRDADHQCTGSTGATCSYLCDTGYSDSAGGALVCGSDNKFSPPRAACHANPCDNFPIENSNRDLSDPCSGSTTATCDFTCDNGWHAPGAEDGGTGTVTCDGSSFSYGACTPNSCVDRPIAFSNHDQSDPCTGSTTDTCSFVCSPGYECDPCESTCGVGGAFSIATCEGKLCADMIIDNVEGGPMTCSGQTTDDTHPACEFTCARGFGIGSGSPGSGDKDQVTGASRCLPVGGGDPVFDVITCDDIDECETNNAGCALGATCVNTLGSFYCAGCQGGATFGPPGCCHGGTAVKMNAKGEPFGTFDVCCGVATGDPVPPSAADCTTGSPPGSCISVGLNAWVNATGCIGPPSAGQSTLTIFQGPPSNQSPLIAGHASTWTEVESQVGPFAAGAHLVLAIDPRDTQGHRNAELTGVCEASYFTIAVSTPRTLQSSPVFSGQRTSVGAAYYAAALQITKQGSYDVSATVYATAMTSLLSIQIVHANPSLEHTRITATDDDPVSAAVSAACLSGTCSSSVSQSGGTTIRFDIDVYDAYDNPINDLPDKDVRLEVTPDGNVQTTNTLLGSTYTVSMRTTDSKSGSYSVDAKAGSQDPGAPGSEPPTCVTLVHFVYTAAPVSVDKVQQFLSPMYTPMALTPPCGPPDSTCTGGNIFAGEVDQLTMVVKDDSPTCIQQAPYSKAIGCSEEFGLGEEIGPVVIRANGTQALFQDGMGLPLPVWDGSTAGGQSLVPPAAPRYFDDATEPCDKLGTAKAVCLDFVFTPTSAGIYSVYLELRSVDMQKHKDLGPDFVWQVLVSPAELDFDMSSSSGPEFQKSEAGRPNTFPVVPPFVEFRANAATSL